MLEPTEKHRKEIRQRVILPVLIPGLLLVLLTVVLFGLAATDHISSQQIGVIAGLLVTLFVLLPMAIITIALAAVMVFIAFGSHKIYEFSRPPLEKARHYSGKMAEVTQQTSWRISQPVIQARARLDAWQTAANEIFGIPQERK